MVLYSFTMSRGIFVMLCNLPPQLKHFSWKQDQTWKRDSVSDGIKSESVLRVFHRGVSYELSESELFAVATGRRCPRLPPPAQFILIPQRHAVPPGHAAAALDASR